VRYIVTRESSPRPLLFVYTCANLAPESETSFLELMSSLQPVRGLLVDRQRGVVFRRDRAADERRFIARDHLSTLTLLQCEEADLDAFDDVVHLWLLRMSMTWLRLGAREPPSVEVVTLH